MRSVDVIIVGAGLASAAAAKRLVDAGLETLILERKELPRHKICSGILSPRGHRFLLENFGPLPREILHEPTWCRGVTFHFPSMVSIPMDFFGGSTPHLHRKYSDYWAVQRSGAEVHDRTSFVGLEDKARATGKPYCASSSSTLYHLSACPTAQRIKAANRHEYDSIDDAEAAGLKPCSRCVPK